MVPRWSTGEGTDKSLPGIATTVFTRSAVAVVDTIVRVFGSTGH